MDKLMVAPNQSIAYYMANPASQTTAAIADARGSVVECCPANVGPVGMDANVVGVTV